MLSCFLSPHFMVLSNKTAFLFFLPKVYLLYHRLYLIHWVTAVTIYAKLLCYNYKVLCFNYTHQGLLASCFLLDVLLHLN